MHYYFQMLQLQTIHYIMPRCAHKIHGRKFFSSTGLHQIHGRIPADRTVEETVNKDTAGSWRNKGIHLEAGSW